MKQHCQELNTCGKVLEKKEMNSEENRRGKEERVGEKEIVMEVFMR